MSTQHSRIFSLNDLHQARKVGTLYQRSSIVVLDPDVLETILDFSNQDLHREQGGFLLGAAYGEEPPFTVIRHFHPAVQARSRAASLTFTHETWAALHREVAQRYPGEQVVGWHHTHPGFGIFLSGYDLFIHRHFFSEPWQVAMVVDPRRKEFGFYHWRDEEIKDCGFVVPADSLSAK